MVSSQWAPQYKTIQPIGGFNNAVAPEQLQDSESPDLLNVVELQGQLQCDTGYRALGQAVRGAPQGVFQFDQTNGSSFLCLVTTQTFYTFSSTTQTWILASNGTSTTLNGAVASGNSFTFTSVAGFANGNLIGITLSDGTQLQTTISGIVGSVVTTADAIPGGKTALNGAQVVRAPSLSGDVNKAVTGDTVAADNLFVFTNGVDHVQRFDGTAVTDLPNLAAIVSSCRWLLVYNGHLVLLDCTEGGTRHPQRVRRSTNVDITDWTTGNSGFNDLIETDDFILGASVMGPYMIVYRENSIMRCSYTGDATQLFFFEYTVRNVGPFAGRAIAQMGGSHSNEKPTSGIDCFAGKAGVFKYSGGADLLPIGDQIFHYAMSQGGNLNTGKITQVFLKYIQTLDEIWFFYPSGGSQYPDTLLRYDNAREVWHRRRFANSFIALGFYVSASSISWSQDTTRWIDKNYSWDNQTLQENAPIVLLCSPDTNQVYAYDFTATTDAGMEIGYYYTTKNFILQDRKVTMDAVVAYGKGNNIKLEISTDRGRTWKTMGAFNFGSSPSQQRIDYQVTDDFFSLRFSGTDPSFALTWYAPKYYEASEW